MKGNNCTLLEGDVKLNGLSSRKNKPDFSKRASKFLEYYGTSNSDIFRENTVVMFERNEQQNLCKDKFNYETVISYFLPILVRFIQQLI